MFRQVQCSYLSAACFAPSSTCKTKLVTQQKNSCKTFPEGSSRGWRSYNSGDGGCGDNSGQQKRKITAVGLASVAAIVGWDALTQILNG